jgi:2,3-dihydroxybenzoate---[aryl-carrier protein] ligase
VLQPGQALSFEELLGFLETKEMAKIKLPERLLIVKELPLSNFGKVSKKKLSEMAAERASSLPRTVRR